MSFLLPILRESSISRHTKAVRGLRDGAITVTLIRRTESEIRAAVKNGHGLIYGVTLTEHGPFCSCKDALHRGTICKHAIAVALFCLQQQPAVVEPIHLMWDNGDVLCGHTLTYRSRFWQRWTLNALNWSDIVCQTCVHVWTHPQQAKAAA